MKLIGTILILAGITMFIFRGFTFIKEKKVAEIGPIEINKKEQRIVYWPFYAGGIALIAGIVLLSSSKKT